MTSDQTPTVAVERQAGRVFLFTTVARNYLSQATVLLHSIKEHQQGANFCCFVTDGYDDEAEIPEAMRGHVFDCRDLSIDDFEERAFKYSVTEFATSLKPHIFKHIFEKGYEYAVFLDPDTKLYCDLGWIEDHLRDKSILVTPHVVDSAPYKMGYRGKRPHKGLAFWLHAGAYNTGFLVIRNDPCGREYIELLSSVLKDECTQELCYDQSWAWLISYFYNERVGVVSDGGANVAYWNLHERPLTRGPGSEYSVRGDRLKFMHFSHIEKFFGGVTERKKLPVSLEENPEYRELYEGYVAELVAAGFLHRKEIPYRYNYFDDGSQIQDEHRKLFRRVADDRAILSPFSVRGGFHGRLQARKLLRQDSGWGRSVFRRLMAPLRPRVLFRLIYKIIGPERYAQLLREIGKVPG